MATYRPAGALVTAATLLAASGADLAAQMTGTIDLGGTWVDYEGFLGSAATYVTPTFRYDARTLSVGGSGTLIVFESGNSVMQGLFAGAWRFPVSNGLSGELAGAAGFNAYSEAAGYQYALVTGRVHASSKRAGGWVGATAGGSSVTPSAGTPVTFELGVWTVQHKLALRSTASRTWISGAAYLDIEAFGRWTDVSLQVDGSIGGRTWTGGGGRGIYGELQLLVPVTRHFSAVVAGGRYPTDPVRGVLAANFVSAALRITAVRTTTPSPLTRRASDQPEDVAPGEAHITLVSEGGAIRTIRVTAPGAEAVGVIGDLTDWAPARLVRVGAGLWELKLQLPPGLYRIAIQIDNGPWIVPRGLRSEKDGFGTMVGLLVVP